MESSTGDIRVRLNSTQKRRLQNLAESTGKTLSGYVRDAVFREDFSLHFKLNKMLQLLEAKNEAKK